MCNLYRMTTAQAEIARIFGATDAVGSNAGEEVYPGYPGMVVEQGELRSMVWGFPLVLKSKRTGQPLKPKPVNNARTDKLGSFMWRDSFQHRRCLIPLTAWAEAEGEKGRKTRTWLSLPEQQTFAVAGIWRDSAEWGPCYSMVMTEAAGDAAQVHNRMPVILSTDDYRRWSDGAADDARQLCRPWQGSVTIERTQDPWVRR